MWRMALCGIHESIAYSLKYPGRSRYELACQGSELMIGLGKLYCAQLGTGKWDMPEKLMNYYDLNGVVNLKNNQIDVGKLIKQLEKKGKKLIFNGEKTIKLEKKIEKGSPLIFSFLVQCLDKWEVGEPMHDFIKQINECIALSPNAWKIDKIKQICNKNSTNISNSNIEVGSDEYNAMLAKIQELHENYIKNPNVKNSLKLANTVLNDEL